LETATIASAGVARGRDRRRSIETHSQKKVELLGRRLRKLRKEHRWSPAELADRAGLDAQDVIRIERGEIRVGLETVIRLLGVFGVQARDLVRLAEAEREEDPPSERFRRDLSG